MSASDLIRCWENAVVKALVPHLVANIKPSELEDTEALRVQASIVAGQVDRPQILVATSGC